MSTPRALVAAVLLLGVVFFTTPLSQAAVIASQTSDTAAALAPDFGGLNFGLAYTYALGSGLSGSLDSLTVRFDGKVATSNWSIDLYCRTGSDLIASSPCGSTLGGEDGLRNQEAALPATTVAGPADYTATWAGSTILEPENFYFFKLIIIPTEIFSAPAAVLGSADSTSYLPGECYAGGGQTSDGLCGAVTDPYFKLQATPVDRTAPTLVEYAPITASTDSTPAYTFTASEAATLTYGGACSSADLAAAAGLNIVQFNGMSAGTYADCTITATDAAGNVGSALAVTPFTILPPPVIIPLDKRACMDDGWKNFTNPSFKNQGQCVSHIVSLTK
jgi:hypothetical protein